MLIKCFGETIRKRRKDLRITQSYLAKVAEISPNTLYKLERGKGNPSLEVLNKLTNVLGLVLTLDVKKI